MVLFAVNVQPPDVTGSQPTDCITDGETQPSATAQQSAKTSRLLVFILLLIIVTYHCLTPSCTFSTAHYRIFKLCVKEVITESPVFFCLCVSSGLCVPSQGYIFGSIFLHFCVTWKKLSTEAPVFSQLCVASCLCVPSQAYIFCSIALL